MLTSLLHSLFRFFFDKFCLTAHVRERKAEKIQDSTSISMKNRKFAFPSSFPLESRESREKQDSRSRHVCVRFLSLSYHVRLRKFWDAQEKKKIFFFSLARPVFS